MAGTDGQTPATLSALVEQLAREPFGFDFFRAVRLLENQRRDLPRIGHSESLGQDPVRFGQNPHLIFAPSTIESFKASDTGGRPRFMVYFFGLFGPNGPLPPHLTEFARERQLNFKDPTIPEFFNVFHHRLVCFFYRAWAANQKAVDLDRPEAQRYASFIGSFFGLGTEALQQRDAVPDWAKLFFSGRLVSQSRNAEGLEAILQAYFEIKTQVQSFVGRWFDLPPDCVCKLGQSPETGSLGLTTIVGARFWDCQLSFRIRLGPMKLADYERMLPRGDSFQRLKSWVLNYCGQHFYWDAQLVLEASEVPATRLGKAGRLGWTTWLQTGTPATDADDLILQGDQGHGVTE